MKFLLILIVASFAADLSLANSRIVPSGSDVADFDFERLDMRNIVVLEAPKIFDGLKDFVNAVIRHSLEALNEISVNVERLFRTALSEMKDFAEKTTKDLINLTSRLEEELIVLQAESQGSSCIDKYRDQIKDVIDTASEKIQFCLTKGITNTQNNQTTVKDYVQELKQNVKDLRDLFKKCVQIFDPVHTVKCVWTEAKNIQTKISNILSNLKNALVQVTSSLHQIVKDARHCIKNTFTEAQQGISQILEEAQHCNDQVSTTPEGQDTDTENEIDEETLFRHYPHY